MRELEEQVLYLSMGQDERNALLVSENRALRGIVMQTKHQASRIGLLLKDLNDSLANCTAEPTSPVPNQDPENQNGGDSAYSRPRSRKPSSTSAKSVDSPTCPALTLESPDPGAAQDSNSPDFFPDATQFASMVDANVSGAMGNLFEGDCGPSSFQTDICFHVGAPDSCKFTAIPV